VSKNHFKKRTPISLINTREIAQMSKNFTFFEKYIPSGNMRATEKWKNGKMEK
jgi:hypothetical protein